MATTSPLDAEIGNRVKAAAKAAGVTHEELALEAGLADRTFARLVSGGAHWKMVHLSNIADALKVDPADLAFGKASAA